MFQARAHSHRNTAANHITEGVVMETIPLAAATTATRNYRAPAFAVRHKAFFFDVLHVRFAGLPVGKSNAPGLLWPQSVAVWYRFQEQWLKGRKIELR